MEVSELKMFTSPDSVSASIPAFLLKLWTLVEDPSTDELIHWDHAGTSFHVINQQRFSREILPLYFKHNNIASFIRQLNMYGFRKVSHIDQGGLKIEKDEVQFQHAYFQRGDKMLLENIKRKVPTSQVMRTSETIAPLKADEVSRVLAEMSQVKVKQDETESNLEYIKKENKLLWREVANLRQKHHKQQQIVNKLIQFLVSLVSSRSGGLTIPTIRRMPLAINDVSQISSPPSAQNINPGKIVNPVNQYSVESPSSENLVISEESQGPIIHEVIDPANFIITQPQNSKISDSATSFIQPATIKISNLTSNPQANFLALNPDIKIETNPDNFLISQQEQNTLSPKVETTHSLDDELDLGLSLPTDNYQVYSANPPPPHSGLNTPTPVISNQSQRRKRPSGSDLSQGAVSSAKKTSQENKESDSRLNDKATSKDDALLPLTNSSETDDLTLSSDTLDWLSDIDGLKGILQDQYKVDSEFLTDLFEASNPWELNTGEDLDAESDEKRNEAGTSGNMNKKIQGTEIIEYNPKELFTDLFSDGAIGDIDDID